ncbi:TPA: hypothetical protein DCG61_02365 [Patescibacteria group bacterium]|nr:hypothetical protein [Patescibacteria group bacterium]
MSNQFVQKIASVVLILGIFVSLFMAAQTARAQTQSLPITQPFGGAILFSVPPSPTCGTAHTIIFDFRSMSVRAVAPVPSSRIYENRNLTTPGTFVLGNYTNTPIPCLLPYPIFPISQVGTS